VRKGGDPAGPPRSGQSFHDVKEHASFVHCFHWFERVLWISFLFEASRQRSPLKFHEAYASQHSPVINPVLALTLWKYGSRG
jgi:hypothetical protein